VFLIPFCTDAGRLVKSVPKAFVIESVAPVIPPLLAPAKAAVTKSCPLIAPRTVLTAAPVSDLDNIPVASIPSRYAVASFMNSVPGISDPA